MAREERGIRRREINEVNVYACQKILKIEMRVSAPNLIMSLSIISV